MVLLLQKDQARPGPSVVEYLRILSRMDPGRREPMFKAWCDQMEQDYKDINWMANRWAKPGGDVEYRGQRNEMVTFDRFGNIYVGMGRKPL
jgi:hypothetical protein